MTFFILSVRVITHVKITLSERHCYVTLKMAFGISGFEMLKIPPNSINFNLGQKLKHTKFYGTFFKIYILNNLINLKILIQRAKPF